MVRFIKFVDTFDDQHAYRVEDIKAFFITSSTNIDVYVRNADNPAGHSPSSFEGPIPAGISDDKISITVEEGFAEEILNEELIYPMVKDHKNFIIIDTSIEGITVVSHAAGT